MTREQRDGEIVRMAAEGMLLKDIAAALGMAPNSPGAILKRMGFARPTKPQKAPSNAIDAERVLKLWRNGLSVFTIAEALGSNYKSVNNVIAKAGVREPGTYRARYDGSVGGGSGRSGFAGNMARRT